MSPILIIIIFSIVSLGISWKVYPTVYRYAIKHHIVDQPNSRKLQKQPVPVLGGSAIAIGGILPIVVYFQIMHIYDWYAIVIFGICALVLGVLDDIRNLSARLRFAIELLMVGGYIWLSSNMIDSFHGLWDIQILPKWLGICISLIAGVGIINSINMIDGIDGYSSGFVMVACLLFSVLFFYIHEYAFAGFMVIFAMNIIPFFYHNAFNTSQKMYIGDGGTLMLGAIMVSTIFYALSSQSPCVIAFESNINVIAFCIAVLCIPIFDTLRVMVLRIKSGISPFKADTNHLHHLFLRVGFNHLQTSMTIIAINTMIVVLWWISYMLKADMTIQLYLVLILGVVSTFGLGVVLDKCAKRKAATNSKQTL